MKTLLGILTLLSLVSCGKNKISIDYKDYDIFIGDSIEDVKNELGEIVADTTLIRTSGHFYFLPNQIEFINDSITIKPRISMWFFQNQLRGFNVNYFVSNEKEEKVNFEKLHKKLIKKEYPNLRNNRKILFYNDKNYFKSSRVDSLKFQVISYGVNPMVFF